MAGNRGWLVGAGEAYRNSEGVGAGSSLVSCQLGIPQALKPRELVPVSVPGGGEGEAEKVEAGEGMTPGAGRFDRLSQTPP